MAIQVRLPRSNPFWRVAWLFLAIAVAAIAACASDPDVEDVLGPADTAGHFKVVGPPAPLSRTQSRMILDRLQRDTKDPSVLDRQLALQTALSDNPLIGGNKVTLLRDGEETFPAMFRAIRGARHHVNLEYYIVEDVEVDGVHLSDLIIERLNAGVQVNIIYDSFGSLGTPPALFDRLKAAGARLVTFNPVNPLDAGVGYSPNDRDHRKMLVVDGATAIVGGVNLSKVYENREPDDPKAAQNADHAYWLDTDAEIDGPAVAELQKLFLDTWAKQGGAPLAQADFLPTLAPQGDHIVRIIGSTPGDPHPLYYVSLLSAIRNAESRVWLMTGYFVPTHQEVEDLVDAARRGVDVRLVLPSRSDSAQALEAGRSHYEDLLDGGVKIYERQNAVLHSKLAVIDGAWLAIGSSNLDRRSVVFNNEIDAVIIGRETASEAEKMFEREIARSHAIERQTWAGRPFSERLDEFQARLWEYWL